MTYYKFIFGIALIFCLGSCSTLLYSDFKTYRLDPLEEGGISPQLDGIYFYRDFSRSDYCGLPLAFYLYTDGSISSKIMRDISNVPDSSFWQQPEEYLRTMRWGVSPVNPGHYVIRGNTITMELFSMTEPFPKIFRFEGKIDSDSGVISFDKQTDYSRCYERAYGADVRNLESVTYKLYQTSVRPDSSSMWIKDKSWYRNKVWHNQ